MTDDASPPEYVIRTDAQPNKALPDVNTTRLSPLTRDVRGRLNEIATREEPGWYAVVSALDGKTLRSTRRNLARTYPPSSGWSFQMVSEKDQTGATWKTLFARYAATASGAEATLPTSSEPQPAPVQSRPVAAVVGPGAGSPIRG